MNRSELARKEINDILKKYNAELCVYTKDECPFVLSVVAFTTKNEKGNSSRLIERGTI